MKISNNVMGCALALTFSFSQSAFALIIEGTFSGTLGQFINENMDVTPEAKFWHENENEYQLFTGSFWYDTELAGTGLNNPYQPDQVTYTQERDWVHASLVGANGGTLDLMSRGGLRNFSKHPKDSVTVGQYDDGSTLYDRLILSYFDYKPATQHGVTSLHREGSLAIASKTPILDGFGLAQNFEFSSELNNNKHIGSVYFQTLGVLNGVRYLGDFWAQVNKFEIHTRDSVSVPEPSSLLLFLGPLVFLFWRANLFNAHFRAWFVKRFKEK